LARKRLRTPRRAVSTVPLPGLVGSAVWTAHAGGHRRDKEISARARVAGLIDRASCLANASCVDVVGELSSTSHLRLRGRDSRLRRRSYMLFRSTSPGKSGKPAAGPASWVALVGERMENAWSHKSLPCRTLLMPKGFGVGQISPGRPASYHAMLSESSARVTRSQPGWPAVGRMLPGGARARMVLR
jgi:hypothetical protein